MTTNAVNAPLRYMGTKRYVAPRVHEILRGLPSTPSRFVDLFAGTGAVAGSLEGIVNVTCSDALTFPTVLARARFLPRPRPVTKQKVTEVIDLAREIASASLREAQAAVTEEDRALDDGPRILQTLLDSARHVGNDESLRDQALLAKETCGHQLTILYFSRGYFSTRQAAQLDGLRAAIDILHPAQSSDDGLVAWTKGSVRDVMLAAWVAAASRIVNSPGHTAQHLTAKSEAGFKRLRANWRRDAISAFAASLSAVAQLGSGVWRQGNSVMQADACSGQFPLNFDGQTTVFYADPPYTKDHYSRFYHVLETLIRYDYPESKGVGRVRPDRHLSDFSYRSRVSAAFGLLGEMTANAGATLIVSYPDTGLLPEAELLALLSSFGVAKCVADVPRSHSTMGGSNGAGTKEVRERLYLLCP